MSGLKIVLKTIVTNGTFSLSTNAVACARECSLLLLLAFLSDKNCEQTMKGVTFEVENNCQSTITVFKSFTCPHNNVR